MQLNWESICLASRRLWVRNPSSPPAPIAQLDRALGYELRGWGFKSLQVYQKIQSISSIGRALPLHGRGSWFETDMDYQKTCENNSVGRVLSFQVRCRGFESRFSLQYKMRRKLKWNGNATLRTQSLRVRISLGAPRYAGIGPIGKATVLQTGIALFGVITRSMTKVRFLLPAPKMRV